MKLHTRLLVALVAGAALGLALHGQADAPWLQWLSVNLLQPIGQLFLRSIFMVVVPLVFSALVIGVYQLGQGRELTGVAGRTLFFTIVLSATSVAIAVVLVNAIRPGDAVDRTLLQTQAGSVQTIQANAAAAQPLSQTIVELIPRNPIDSAVRALDGGMLQLMIFALIFGIAVSAASSKTGDNVLIALLEQIFDACMRIVHFAMTLAPVAVFAIILNTTLTFGANVFAALLMYVLTVVTGLALQQFGVYSVMLRLVGKRSPSEFFKK